MSIYLAYLVSICLFILGLKGLSSPRSARRGNFLSMLGMLIAVAVTLLDRQIISFTWIVVGVVVGGGIGVLAARLVKMTAMPQMVALFNAFGGGASALVVLAQYLNHPNLTATSTAVTTGLSLYIGMVTLTGSIIAFAKLQGIMKGAPIVFPGQKILNLLLHLAIVGLSYSMCSISCLYGWSCSWP